MVKVQNNDVGFTAVYAGMRLQVLDQLTSEN